MSHKITGIVVHCSASEFGCASVIRDWHVNGNGWRDIGYNYVILNGYPTSDHLEKEFYLDSLDGSIEVGRSINANKTLEGLEIGAHARGLNASHIGICMIGNRDFSDNQFESINKLIFDLLGWYDLDIPDVIGHYESSNSQGKTCPNFDMEVFRADFVNWVRQF